MQIHGHARLHLQTGAGERQFLFLSIEKKGKENVFENVAKY